MSSHASDALVLDASTVIFFAAPHAPLGSWSGALSFAWLGITAWGSIALRQPFTLGMARRHVPRELYEQRAFRRAQTSLTRL